MAEMTGKVSKVAKSCGIVKGGPYHGFNPHVGELFSHCFEIALTTWHYTSMHGTYINIIIVKSSWYGSKR